MATNTGAEPIFTQRVHRVVPGETLNSIAAAYGITVDSLLGNNQYIVNPDLIYPGQILIVPSANRQSYIIRPGDTLFSIAQKFDVPIGMLASINGIDYTDVLYVDQILLIPKIYKVAAGDTLNSISQRFGISLTDLLLENNIGPTSPIYIGQPLVIPFRSAEQEELSSLDNTFSPIAQRFPDTFFYKGKPDGLRVALTFDDGPSQVGTNAVLDILKMHQVPATFFLLGDNIPGNSDVVERIIAEGHTVANHSMTHSDLRNLTEEQLGNEILSTENKIYDITGLRTALMRPTYGFVNDNLIRQLRDMGYKVIQWSVDTKDWRDMDADQVLINTIPDIRDGSIILMHDSLPRSATKEVLPEIIHTLRSQGYTFVTVDELLGVNAYK